MTAEGLLQIGLFLLLLAAAARPLGAYVAWVYTGRPAGLERGLYRLVGVRPEEEMGWREYACALLLLGAGAALFLYALQRLQGVPPGAALETAVSAATGLRSAVNGGEALQSPLLQKLGGAAQSLLTAAAGLAVFAASLRGAARRGASTIGNFWVDWTRGTLYLLLPSVLLLAAILISQGAVQTLTAPHGVALLDPVLRRADLPPQTAQMLPLGPVATQAAVETLTRSGAFTPHPFSAPTPLAGFLLALAQALIPAGLCIAGGRLAGSPRAGWALLAVLLITLAAFQLTAYRSAAAGNPRLAAMGVDEKSGGDLEGKELRSGVAGHALAAIPWSVLATPLGGAVAGLAFPALLLAAAVLQGKKIERRDLGALALLALVLGLVALLGPLAGRTAEPARQILGALALLIARFWTAVPILAVAGGLARRS
jgi:K+-transporting ATPase ATPase A chain